MYTRVILEGVYILARNEATRHYQSAANHLYVFIVDPVLGMTLNCLHRAIYLPHPGANDLSC